MPRTSWVFPRGHRIRFAVTNAMWPMLWPTPHPMTTTLSVGGSTGAELILPVIPAVIEQEDVAAAAPAFLEPSAVAPELPGLWGSLDGGNTSGYGEIHAIERDEVTGQSFGVATNGTVQQYPWGTERFDEAIEHRTSDADPSKTSVTGANRARAMQMCAACVTLHVLIHRSLARQGTMRSRPS